MNEFNNPLLVCSHDADDDHKRAIGFVAIIINDDNNFWKFETFNNFEKNLNSNMQKRAKTDDDTA